MIILGGDERPRSLSGRLILSVWWMFTILMLATYTANIAAYLTVTIIESPINSLEELANHADIRPLIFSGSNLHTLFKVLVHCIALPLDLDIPETKK